MNASPILRLAPLLVLAAPLGAQIAIVDSGAAGNQVNLAGTYTQNFDTLPTPLQMTWTGVEGVRAVGYSRSE